MIIKILSPAKISFEGIQYNESKVEKEKGALLEAVNFNGLSEKATKKDYVMYLQNQSSLNKRVKLPQFHATISAKGTERSFEELQSFAKEYMKDMGYGNNPYLIYAHKDTDNNHIHIVSTRIDKDGKKINDSMERVRSQKVRNRLLGINSQKEIDKKLQKINQYKVKTVAQYKLLLEKNFAKVIENNKGIDVYYSDMKINIPKTSIEQRIKNSKSFYKTGISKAQREKLNNLLINLSKNHSIEELKLLAEKHHIELEFFKNKENKYFGYVVIDHKNKAIYKGSDICSLDKLQSSQIKNNIEGLISELSENNLTFEQLNEKIKSINYAVDKNGFIFNYSKGVKGKRSFAKIPKSLLYPFVYNSNKELIKQKYNVLNDSERKMIAMAYKIKKEDISICTEPKLIAQELENRKNLLSYYNELLSFQKQNADLPYFLEQSGIHIFKIDKEFHIADTNLDFIGKVDFSEDIEQIIEHQKSYKDLTYYPPKSMDFTDNKSTSLIRELNNLAYEDTNQNDNALNKKRKKKGIKR
ncbi:MAG: relaxase/mobilization nuclease domain-containing protein [Flavobacteriaceae bacterium]|nr:relaxase/mobilization nuclease domain-containing protein [Flavobacteriaceae bacterium]